MSFAAASRISSGWDVETATTARILRSLARRTPELKAEAAEYEKQMERVARSWRPELLDQFGIGPIVAATGLCAWSHPGRYRSDAACANLAGVAPIPASSGQTTRFRLN